MNAPKLVVWYGAMPESNGKTNWTAILHKGDIASGMTIDRSEYPDRVRYEADRVRWLIGELAEEPFILDYDADKHSGYVTPPPAKLSTETVDKGVDRLTDEQLDDFYRLACEQTDDWCERQEREPTRAQSNALFIRNIVALLSDSATASDKGVGNADQA